MIGAWLQAPGKKSIRHSPSVIDSARMHSRANTHVRIVTPDDEN
jgi:hypothetical protein